MVRAPGGQLITRIKTEAAAGKLAADVVNHSDRGLMLELADLFQDYTPPNAADYRPDALVSPKLWPGVTLGWAIAYNTAAGEERAQDLDGSHQARIQGQADRPGRRPVGRHDLDPHHVRAPGAGRGLLEEAGGARHRALSVRRADSPTRWCAARSRSRRCSTTSSTPRSSKARRPRRSSRPRACRSSPTPTASPRPRKSPNAAKLFMNWRLSKEGQAFAIKKLGNITSLKEPPAFPKGWDPEGDQGLGAEVRRVREAARAAGSRSGTRPTDTASDRSAAHREPREALRDRASRPSTA